MAEQIIEISGDERSPCIGCKYEKEDKSECMDSCKRLSAFQHGHPYANIAHFEKTAQISAKEPEISKTGKPTAQKTSWKKAMPKREVSVSVVKCEYCGRLASIKNKIQRGLCKQTCYNKWRRGTIKLKSGRKWEPKFPLLGEKKKLDKRKDGKMIKPKTTRAVMDEAYNEIINEPRHETIQPEITENKVTIDFTNYPELYQKILKISKLQYLPVNHAVINLIVMGVMWGENKIAAERERIENNVI